MANDKTEWLVTLNGTELNTCLTFWDKSVQSPRNDHIFTT